MKLKELKGILKSECGQSINCTPCTLVDANTEKEVCFTPRLENIFVSHRFDDYAVVDIYPTHELNSRNLNTIEYVIHVQK